MDTEERHHADVQLYLRWQRPRGYQHEKPNLLYIPVEELQLANETSWEIKDEDEPDSVAGYRLREVITAKGKLNDARLYAITLDDSDNLMFTDISVTIYWADIEELRKTSTVPEYSFFRDKDEPEEGMLEDELGSINVYGGTEYDPDTDVHAQVFLGKDQFSEVAAQIKAGGITSAQITLLADLYDQDYESLGAGIAGHWFSYAILCNNDDDRFGGGTSARLQEIRLYWSPKVSVLKRDFDGDDDEANEDAEQRIERAVAVMNDSVHAIRKKVDAVYSAAIFVLILLALGQASHWFL
ncbi:MAG: hypothetical protein HRU32_05075 [Rhodobacteraceae bacterium]|nr:hypothetical protein [Paracoccaceae bacterium]